MPSIRIESDGTKKGTKIFLNDNEISGIRSLFFDLFRSFSDDDGDDTVLFEFTREELTDDGMLKEYRFKLPRKDEVGALANNSSIKVGNLTFAVKKRKLDPKAKVRNRPSPVFPSTHPKVTDNKDHFPLGSEDQARNALARANQYDKAPSWWSGSLQELKNAVARAVKSKYPGIKVTKQATSDILDRTSATIKVIDGKFCVFSKDGSKNLGCYKSREEAVKRLAQIEFFKKKK